MISVITVFSDSCRKNLLKECINSLGNQTSHENWELIVINQTSIDVQGIIASKLLFDVSFKVINIPETKKVPVARARNIALEAAQGDHFLMLDDDDYLGTNVLARCSEYPGVILYSDIIRVQPNRARRENRKQISEEDTLKNLLRKFYCLHPLTIPLEPDIRFDENFILASDYELVLRLTESYPLLYVPDTLYYWRIHNGPRLGQDSKLQNFYFLWAAEKFVQERDKPYIITSKTKHDNSLGITVEPCQK